MKKTLHIALILLFSGMPALLAQTITEPSCCHTSQKEKKAESDSCCVMEKETPREAEKTTCNMFDLNPSSFDACGCIHDYVSVDQSILTNVNLDFSKTLTELDTDVTLNYDITSVSQNYSTNITYSYKVPIYISVSSFLI